MKRRIGWCATVAALVAGLLWWRFGYEGPSDSASVTVTVFAAASTIDAMEEILAAFLVNRDANEARVTFKANYASSSSLRLMIANGAKPDVFLSAYQEPDGSALLSNRLVAIQRTENAKPMSLQDFKGRIAMGDPQHVPAGIYAKKFLQQARQWQQIQPIAGSDVRQVLAMICNGGADVAIVYATDAISVADKVKVVYEFSSPDIPIVYSLVTWPDKRTSTRSLAAADLASFFHSEEASAIFQRHGFTPLHNQ